MPLNRFLWLPRQYERDDIIQFEHLTVYCCLSYLYVFFQASRLIVTFDEHVISNNFKFGVIYQKFGQVSEKVSICGNQSTNRRESTNQWCLISALTVILF